MSSQLLQQKHLLQSLQPLQLLKRIIPLTAITAFTTIRAGAIRVTTTTRIHYINRNHEHIITEKLGQNSVESKC